MSRSKGGAVSQTPRWGVIGFFVGYLAILSGLLMLAWGSPGLVWILGGFGVMGTALIDLGWRSAGDGDGIS
jgi:hypothetical protein